MDKMTGREHDCSGDLNRIRHYFKKVLGYNVTRYVTKTQVDGKRASYTKYFLQDILGDILERPNTILNGDWFKNQCEKYDRFVLEGYKETGGFQTRYQSYEKEIVTMNFLFDG